MQRRVHQQVKGSGQRGGRGTGKLIACSEADEATTQGDPSVAGPGLLEASVTHSLFQEMLPTLRSRALNQKCKGCKKLPWEMRSWPSHTRVYSLHAFCSKVREGGGLWVLQEVHGREKWRAWAALSLLCPLGTVTRRAWVQLMTEPRSTVTWELS